jgi:hypothetical protein
MMDDTIEDVAVHLPTGKQTATQPVVQVARRRPSLGAWWRAQRAGWAAWVMVPLFTAAVVAGLATAPDETHPTQRVEATPPRATTTPVPAAPPADGPGADTSLDVASTTTATASPATTAPSTTTTTRAEPTTTSSTSSTTTPPVTVAPPPPTTSTSPTTTAPTWPPDEHGATEAQPFR